MLKSIKAIFLLIFFSITVHGYSTGLNKNVKIQSGQFTLKAFLSTLSNQSGYIFSYSSATIQANQLISVPANYSNSLDQALNTFLPKGISFDLNGKYIVLQKSEIEKKQSSKLSVNQKTKNSTKIESKIDKDPKKVRLVLPPMLNNSDNYIVSQSSATKDSNVLIYPEKTIEKLTASADSIVLVEGNRKPFSLAEYQGLNFSDDEIRKLKTIDFIKRKTILGLELSSNTPLSALSLCAGMYGFYGIASVASDYNNSYRIGYGAGYSFKRRSNLGVNLHFVQHTLFAGKSYDLGVRATLTHFDPLLSYTVGEGFSFFVGPSFYYSESRYSSTGTATDLGNDFGVGAMIGVRFDIINQIFKDK